MKSKKVAIVVKHLGEGGAQRSAAMLSLMLDKQGYKLTIIALFDVREFTFKGEFIALNSYNSSLKITNKYFQFLNFRRIIKGNKFDFIIDFRGRTNFLREFMICNFIYRTPRNIIFTVRESKIENYFPSPFFLFRSFYKKAFKIIVVSQDIEKKIRQKYLLQNIVTINNGLNFDQIDYLKNENLKLYKNFVISVGRYAKVKQFEGLIQVYAKSVLKSKGINLILLGDGDLKPKLKEIIRQNKLENNVFLVPFTSNPYKFMHNAKFLILSSQREGFPNVLLESLACGTPVVSFNCDTGPSEIIHHEQNGLLVDDQDFDSLQKAINRMVKDEKLYLFCKQNSKKSVEKFHLDTISIFWKNILA